VLVAGLNNDDPFVTTLI